MITKEDLDSAIKECEGQRSPNANTALKLAAFYTIKKELYPEPKEDQPRTIDSGYSYSFQPEIDSQGTIDFETGTEFSELVNGKYINDVLYKLDEIVSNLYIVNPALYRQIIRNLSDL